MIGICRLGGRPPDEGVVVARLDVEVVSECTPGTGRERSRLPDWFWRGMEAPSEKPNGTGLRVEASFYARHPAVVNGLPSDEGIPVSGTLQRRLVLVVQEVCAGRYRAGRVRRPSPTGEERLVGRSAAGAAVGTAEEIALAGGLISWRWHAWCQPASI